MVVDIRKPTPSPRKIVGGAMLSVKGKETGNDSVLILDDSSSDSEVTKLRGRWELASVLNFLNVRATLRFFFGFQKRNVSP